MLVEDEQAVRQLMKDVLELAGYRVIIANHGRHALRIVEEFPGRIDAVVADIVMPYLGGIELVEQLRRLRPRIKVLLISGYHSAWLSERSGPEFENCEFLSKPFLPAQFTERLRALIDKTEVLKVDGALKRKEKHSSWTKPKAKKNTPPPVTKLEN